jgi:MFS family permease
MIAEEAAASAPVGTIRSGYKHYVLAILTLVYVVNYLDRQILNVLLPLIKKEFLLPDAALGALSGTVFAVVYATLGVPLAIFADRFNRRNIIAGSLAVFSLMTVFCGLASRFWHLVLARFGTGIGESGTGPSINSILTDYYEPQHRATALSFYSAGLNVGLLIGFSPADGSRSITVGAMHSSLPAHRGCFWFSWFSSRCASQSAVRQSEWPM